MEAFLNCFVSGRVFRHAVQIKEANRLQPLRLTLTSNGIPKAVP
jgi:hypothetical protein